MRGHEHRLTAPCARSAVDAARSRRTARHAGCGASSAPPPRGGALGMPSCESVSRRRLRRHIASAAVQARPAPGRQLAASVSVRVLFWSISRDSERQGLRDKVFPHERGSTGSEPAGQRVCVRARRRAPPVYCERFSVIAPRRIIRRRLGGHERRRPATRVGRPRRGRSLDSPQRTRRCVRDRSGPASSVGSRCRNSPARPAPPVHAPRTEGLGGVGSDTRMCRAAQRYKSAETHGSAPRRVHPSPPRVAWPGARRALRGVRRRGTRPAGAL